LLAALLLTLMLGAPAALAQPLSRGHALKALDSEDADARRRAIVGLARAGTMADTPALVKALRDADGLVRSMAEQALWVVWSRADDARIDAWFSEGVTLMQRGELEAGVAVFSRIIAAKPDFAEGWNKRATIYFLQGDFRRSLADCDEVMKRNPSHFGALAGYGQIYTQLGESERALEYFRRALEVNPNMEGVRASIKALEAQLGARRRAI
jgi:tetratricopeptide (TPR) repeat protein